MEGQKALGFHQKYVNCVSKMNKGLKGLVSLVIMGIVLF